MAYIIFDKGREKLYLTEPQFNKIEKKACECLNIPYHTGPQIAYDTKEYRKNEKRKETWIINFVSAMPKDIYNSIKYFEFSGLDAQREIYDLLWAVRGCYGSVDLACKDNPNSFYQMLNEPLNNQKIFIPSQIESSLDYTFGSDFFLVQRKTISNRFGKKRYISSAFEIVVDRIQYIKGQLTHFYIRFTNNDYIEIEEIYLDSKRRDVRILQRCKYMA